MHALNNKIAIVTGASRGIGASIAKTLAHAGAKVIVNYAGNQAAAAQVVTEIEQAGGTALAVAADVSQSAQVKALFDATEAAFGQADILVNNAGVILYQTLAATTDAEFARLFEVNVNGTFYCLREAATRLADQGRIINFSSSVTRMMLPTYGPYAATKGAVEQLTRVFAKEVGERGITVNSIAPGPTNTDLFNDDKSAEIVQRLAALSAFGRIGEVADISRVVLFLANAEAAWVTGQNIGVNGGVA